MNRIIKDRHEGGMTFFRVEGIGKIKAKPVAIDRGTEMRLIEVARLWYRGCDASKIAKEMNVATSSKEAITRAH